MEFGFPDQVYTDLINMPAFNPLFIIGAPENNVLPSFSFNDYRVLSNSRITTWGLYEKKIHEKYSALLKRDPSDSKAGVFVDRLVKHRNNLNKTILLLPGCWEDFNFRTAFDLAINFASQSTCGFEFVVACQARAGSTPENCHELNPHICGNILSSNISQRFFFSSPIGRREKEPFLEDEL